MRFSPRSLLAWIAVAIAGGDPLGHDRVLAMPMRDLADPAADRTGETTGR